MENLLSILKNTNNVRSLLEKILPLEGTENILSNLVFILNNHMVKDNQIRANAIKLIFELDKDICKEILIKYTQDSDSSIRMVACGMLSYYPPEEKICKCLVDVLLNDPDVDVRLNAVFALEAAGTPTAIKTLQWAKINDLEENWENRSVSHYVDDAINEIKLRNL